ncbi:MAG: hypothetical protein EXS32_05645 [Opitutus sp.]|nr:hypothetical protein [Opitutus sp.]
MNLLRVITFASLGLNGPGITRAADATTPVDYTQRNAPFATATAVTPEAKSPPRDAAMQDKRVEKTTVDKKPAAVGDRRAAVDVEEAREKIIREKNTRRPATTEQPLSQFNQRLAPMATATDTKKPPLVAKFQDGLTSASAANMARFPALDGTTTAKLNRFVFRKNSPEPAAATTPSVTAAAGPSAVQKYSVPVRESR